MKIAICKITYQVIIGLFLVVIWGIDTGSIGFWRWLIGWVVGITLLVDVWPIIKNKITT